MQEEREAAGYCSCDQFQNRFEEGDRAEASVVLGEWSDCAELECCRGYAVKDIPREFEDPFIDVVRRIGEVFAGNTAEAARATCFHPQEG